MARIIVRELLPAELDAASQQPPPWPIAGATTAFEHTGPLIDWLEAHYPHGFPGAHLAALNGQPLAVADYDVALGEGDVLALVIAPGDPFTLAWLGTLLINAIIGMALSYLASAIFGTGQKRFGVPPAPSPVYSLSTPTNAARLGQPIPVIYGTVVTVPDLASQAYSWYENNEMYFGILLCLGQGNHEIQEIRVTESPVDQMAPETLTWRDFQPEDHGQVFGTIQNAMGFYENVYTSPEVADQELSPGGENVKLAGFVSPNTFLLQEPAPECATVGTQVYIDSGVLFGFYDISLVAADRRSFQVTAEIALDGFAADQFAIQCFAGMITATLCLSGDFEPGGGGSQGGYSTGAWVEAEDAMGIWYGAPDCVTVGETAEIEVQDSYQWSEQFNAVVQSPLMFSWDKGVVFAYGAPSGVTVQVGNRARCYSGGVKVDEGIIGGVFTIPGGGDYLEFSSTSGMVFTIGQTYQFSVNYQIPGYTVDTTVTSIDRGTTDWPEVMDFDLLTFADFTGEPGFIYHVRFGCSDAIDCTGSEVEQKEGGVGPFICCPPGWTTTRIQLDVVFPNGLFSMSNDGNLSSETVLLRWFAQLVDDENDGCDAWYTYDAEVTRATNTPQRITYTWDLPRGRYSVRGIRLTPKSSLVNEQTTCLWTGLKAILDSRGQPVYGETTVLAIKAKATNGLASNALNRFSVKAKRLLGGVGASALVPITNADDASSDLTSSEDGVDSAANHIDAFADIYTHQRYGAARPDDELDWDELKALAERHPTVTGFNAIFDQRGTVWEALNLAMAPLWAYPATRGALLTLVEDAAREVPAFVFGPSNIAAESLSLSFQTREPNAPDGVEIEYRDSRNWSQAYYAYPADCAIPEAINLFGCSSTNEAYAYARRAWRQRSLRREFIRFDTELEGHLPLVGDLIGVDHPLLTDPACWIVGSIEPGEDNRVTIEGHRYIPQVYCDDQ